MFGIEFAYDSRAPLAVPNAVPLKTATPPSSRILSASTLLGQAQPLHVREDVERADASCT